MISHPPLDRLRAALESFNEGPALSDFLSPQVVAEFPYGPTLGLPERLDGKPAVEAHLRAVQGSGLHLSDFKLTPIDGRQYLAEYTGHYPAAEGGSLPSALVSIISLDGERITAFREYWNTKQLADAQGAGTGSS